MLLRTLKMRRAERMLPRLLNLLDQFRDSPLTGLGKDADQLVGTHRGHVAV